MDHTEDFNSFRTHAQRVLERFEERRQKFLHQLKFHSVIALVLLLSFPYWFSLLARLDYVNGTPLSSFAAFIVQVIAGAVMISIILIYAALPLFRYRHSVMQIGSALPGMSGVGQQSVSLKSEIFSQLLSYFGKFELYQNRKIPLRNFQNAPGLPAFDSYVGEDYVRGNMVGVSLEMMEAALIDERLHGKAEVFHGLMILIDVCDPNLVLRGSFAGKTLLVSGQQPHEMDEKLTLVPLPDSSFDSYFQAFSTDHKEAAAILKEDTLRNVLKLSECVRNARAQGQHIDDKIAYALSSIASGVSEGMSVIVKAVCNWLYTGSVKSSQTRHDQTLRTPSHTAKQAGQGKAITGAIQCAFYNDKVLILIPYQHNLFEPDPIFKAPLSEDDIILVYTLMGLIKELAGEVVTNLSKSAS
ncbi:MAG: hypothetical protein SFT92_09300 [Rickettsiales bacterium]|nr:hypothetical protein [Rickettsiales bacterium]